jgi:hypothetical protein
MKKLISVSTLALASLVPHSATLTPSGAAPGQKKKPECYQASLGDRNWAMMGNDYIYFDYVVCPSGADPSQPPRQGLADGRRGRLRPGEVVGGARRCQRRLRLPR